MSEDKNEGQGDQEAREGKIVSLPQGRKGRREEKDIAVMSRITRPDLCVGDREVAFRDVVPSLLAASPEIADASRGAPPA